MGTTDDGECESESDEDEGIKAGDCHCKENVGGPRCDKCKHGFWNFTEENPLGCQGQLYVI